MKHIFVKSIYAMFLNINHTLYLFGSFFSEKTISICVIVKRYINNNVIYVMKCSY